MKTGRPNRQSAMKRRTKKVATPLPLLLAELTVFSWETMTRRAAMMVQGTCSAAEYQRMLLEKMRAAQLSAAAVALDRGLLAILQPWHRQTRANARRLRKK
jgi:hypothetical protein